MSLKDAKEKIRKLLNLADDDAAAQGEIDNALRFARRLMLKHNVDQDDLDEPQDPHEIAADTEYDEAKTWTAGANLSQWEGGLMNVIKEVVGTVGCYYDSGSRERKTEHGTLVFDDKGKPKRGTKITFFGPAEDCRDAAGLFTEWATIIVSMARMKYGGCFRGAGRSYAEGFINGMRQNIRSIKREERELITECAFPGSTDTRALTVKRAYSVMEAKRERSTKWLTDVMGITLGSARGSAGGNYNHDAYSSGKADGSKANVTHNRTKKLGNSG